VAKAPAEVEVPQVVGQSESDAVAALSDAGFRIRTRARAVAAPDQDGLVLSQNPGSGKVRKGAQVTITVGRFEASTTTAPETTATTPPAATTPLPAETQTTPEAPSP
jgi:beta-lactam-binding protein with PASTA domain